MHTMTDLWLYMKDKGNMWVAPVDERIIKEGHLRWLGRYMEGHGQPFMLYWKEVEGEDHKVPE